MNKSLKKVFSSLDVLGTISVIRIRIRTSFIARYVYTYEEFAFRTGATAVQQNDSDRTKTQIIKRRIKKNK